MTAPARTRGAQRIDRAFVAETGKVTLANERTVTFTSRRAAIPITVLSSAPYPVDVVVSLASDKFTFPDGNSQTADPQPRHHLGPLHGPGPELG